LVATAALGAHLPPVRILVAGSALAAKSQERPVDILHFDLRPRAGCDVLGGVAALALLFAMLTLQDETRLGRMVKALAVQTGERKSETIMFHMTARAILLAVGNPVHARVISRVRFHPALNLDVAL
jgi:hypothetical protein